jgi:hypothetical protein
MTEQPPDDPVPTPSMPESLGSTVRPNDLTPPEWKRTAMIVWSLIGALFVCGVLLIVLNWRDAGVPSLPEGPDLSFEMPEFRFPDLESPIERREREDRQESPIPPGMERSDGPEARPVGQIDKPGGEGIPTNAEPGVLSGGAGKDI